jgi:hypothetical protein
MHEFTQTMIMYSDTSKAQSKAGTLSRNTSGRGPYTFRSGTRSCTRDKDMSVSTKLKAIIIAAENYTILCNDIINKSDGITTSQQDLHT